MAWLLAIRRWPARQPGWLFDKSSFLVIATHLAAWTQDSQTQSHALPTRPPNIGCAWPSSIKSVTCFWERYLLWRVGELEIGWSGNKPPTSELLSGNDCDCVCVNIIGWYVSWCIWWVVVGHRCLRKPRGWRLQRGSKSRERRIQLG